MEPILIEYPEEEIEFGPHVVYHNSIAETCSIHTHNYYEIFLVADGNAIHEVNGASQLLSKGSLVYMRPSDIHCYSALNSYNYKMFNVGFLLEDCIPMLRYLNIPSDIIDKPILPIHLEVKGELFEYLIFRMSELSKMYPDHKCKILFRSFIADLYYPLTNLSKDGIVADERLIPSWLLDLNIQMSRRENYIEGVDKLYALCNYSQSHIIRSFKKYFGMTPTEYINNKRMNYVCELLINKRCPVSEACFTAGFNNLSYFYSVFKSLYGCTPYKFAKRFS